MSKNFKYSFQDWCKDNNHQDYLDLWDYGLNECKPSEVGYKSNRKYWFKCSRSLHNSYQKRPDIITSTENIGSCKKCFSFGQYLLDTYGNDWEEMYWSKKNTINPFEISIHSKQKVWIKCSDGHEYEITCKTFYQGGRCVYCNNRVPNKTINSVWKTHPYLVKYFVNEEDSWRLTYGSSKKALVKCPNCGYEKYMVVNKLVNREFACRFCSDGISYPNKIMANVLKQLGENFKTEYRPTWAIDDQGCQRRYDFYIPSKNMIIEMDGGWHTKNNNLSGQTKEEAEIIDTWKENQAKLHGLNVIRIDCLKSTLNYVRGNILSSQLANVFDLNIIIWEECHKFSIQNKVKEITNLWNIGYDCTEIAKKEKCDIGTVKKYLKQAEILGWCRYDLERTKRGRIQRATNTKLNKHNKAIIMKKDGVFVCEYKNLNELMDDCVNNKNIALDRRYVLRVCNGVRKTHCGFEFHYNE